MGREADAVADRPDDSPLSEMLAQEPSRLTRRFLYALLTGLVCATVVASLVRVDVTVSAPAVLIPEGKALPIQPEVAGTVIEVRVREGTRVAAGDVLAVLDSEKAGEQLFALSEAALKWKNAERAVNIVLPVEKKKCDDEIDSLDDEVAHLARERGILLKKKEHEEEAYRLLGETHTEQLRKLGEAERRLEADLRTSTETHALRLRVAEARAELYRKQALSEVEYLEAKKDLDEASANLDKVRSQLREARTDRDLAEKTYRRDSQQHKKALADIAQDLDRNEFQARSARSKVLKLRSEFRLKEMEAQTNERTARAEYDLARQRAELTRSPQNRRTVSEVEAGSAVVGRVLVVAPCAGRVGTVSVRRRGEAVERGQTLMTLLPDGPLVAEVRIANRDVGLVRPGQAVKLKLDAFPFAEYGTLKGELVRVPPDAEGTDTPDSFYRATVRLDDTRLPLVSGMTATAEVVTERKTVMQLLLTPLLEPFRN